MKKNFAAAICLLSLIVTPTVFAEQYTSGDSRYATPDFSEQMPEAEAKALKEEVRYKQDKNGKVIAEPLPINLTADYANYDNVSGDFFAEGNVKIKQGKETLLTTKAQGNLKTGDVWLQQGGTLQEPNTEINGEWAHYNFNSKTGEIKAITGKGGKDFFRAPHATIHPDRLVIDEGGETTRCPAVEHDPCLLIKAKTFEIYPNDRMIARDVKVYVKGKHVYSRDTWENSLNKDTSEKIMPRIGYDGSDNGMYVKLQLDYDIGDKNNFHADIPYYSKAGFKPMYTLTRDERNYTLGLRDGWEEEDDEWVEKQSEFRFNYKSHRLIDQLPLTYSGYASHGLWKNEDTGIKSWHTEYAAYLNHDRIYLFNSQNTFLDLTVGKKWVHESRTEETKSTMMYYGTLGQKLGSKWDTWVGYYRENQTSNLYDSGQPDMARELRNGLQYKMDDKNTFAIVNRYDMGQHSNYETAYRWTHRFCCWSIEFEYEHESFKGGDDSFKVKYNFLNW